MTLCPGKFVPVIVLDEQGKPTYRFQCQKCGFQRRMMEPLEHEGNDGDLDPRP
jgi:hypothetical protein